MRRILLASVLLLAGCQTPPKSAYVATADSGAGTVPVGANAVGEACRRLDLGGGAADIYCGEWERPSARVRPGGSAQAADPVALAGGQGSGAAWRSDIDSRFACPDTPRRTAILGDAPAAVLECQYRNGGVAQVVLVATVGGRVWYADTIPAAYEVTERSIAALAGVRADLAAAQPDPQLAARLAARSYKAGDVQAYQTLMREAADANRRGNASAAEKAYRSVIALQQKLLEKSGGQDNPDLATAVMSLGLQLSNQGRYAEADASFARAAKLVGADGGDPTTPPRGSDPTARARLLQYEALHADNRSQPEAALPLLDRSERAYRALSEDAPRGGALALGALQNTAIEATYGVIDVKRDRAWTLRLLGRLADSQAEAQDAARMATARLPATASGWRERETAFISRTQALTVAQQGQPANASLLFDDADRDFARVYAATRPQAETKLRNAAELQRADRPAEALARCREAVEILRHHNDGVDGELIVPCLDAYAAAATGADAQAVLAEMFAAAQHVRSSQTNQQIQQAARRMSENARDPKAAELIRRRDDADRRRDALQRQRLLAAGAAGAAGDTGAAPPDPAALAKLDHDIEAAAQDSAGLEDQLQASSPSYNQLVPRVVSAAEVMAALRPGEVFVHTVLGERAGWALALRDGQIAVGRIEGGRRRVDKLVQRIRATLEPDDAGRVHAFDAASSQELYQVVLAPVAGSLHGAATLTVSPSGPLLSLPFEVLLTGPAKPRDYAGAPWLVRQFAISHVPEPGNFLALRKLAGTSRATSPWFGFGAAANVTLAQARASFPAGSCGEAAQDLADLPVLSDAVDELRASRQLLQAPPSDELTGAAFTTAAVERLPLKRYRILHFAAHGLLPTDLACQTEAAIVTSAPPGAHDASGALLTAARVERLDLDAELVILSACNSGGPGGTAGESLSGLARSFFAANARALMVSHWSLSSEATTVLIPATLTSLRQQPQLGVAGALRAAQLAWLAAYPGGKSHPFFWGALAVFGEGGGTPPPASAAASTAVSRPG